MSDSEENKEFMETMHAMIKERTALIVAPPRLSEVKKWGDRKMESWSTYDKN